MFNVKVYNFENKSGYVNMFPGPVPAYGWELVDELICAGFNMAENVKGFAEFYTSNEKGIIDDILYPMSNFKFEITKIEENQE